MLMRTMKRQVMQLVYSHRHHHEIRRELFRIPRSSVWPKDGGRDLRSLCDATPCSRE